MTAIVLAGGEHSLVSELYPDIPTSLIPVADEPFLYWLTQWIKAQGYNHIVYAAAHKADKLSAWVNQTASTDTSLCVDVVTQSRPLGTGAASVLCAKRFPSNIQLIVNADSLLVTDLVPAIERMKDDSELDGIIVGVPLSNAGRFGSLEVDDNGRLINFKEKTAGHGLVNAGIYLLRQSALESFDTDKELSLEYDCFPKWLMDGKRIEVLQAKGPFIDIGTPEELKKASGLIAQNIYKILPEKEPAY